MSLPITITHAGLAKLPSSTGSGTSAITIAAVGLSNAVFAPDPAMTALPGELVRVTTLSGEAVTPDTMHLLMQDTSANAYSATAFALYLADGTLFAIYGQATPFLTKTAASIGLLAIDIAFASALATSITFGNADFINPPASTNAPGVVQLATLALAQAGTDTHQVLTPATAAGAVLTWLLERDGAGSGIDADLLDGQHGAWYADVVSRLGYTPLNAALYTAASVLAKLITVDGAGSGIDADLFHGLTPAQFVASLVTSGSNANGHWIKRPDGNGGFIVEQFGTVNCNVQTDGTVGITFPIPFGDASSVTIDATPDNPDQTTNLNCAMQRVSNTTGGAVMYVQYMQTTYPLYSFRWRAIGISAT